MSFTVRHDASEWRIAASREEIDAIRRTLARLGERLARGEGIFVEGPGPGGAFAQEPKLEDELAKPLAACVAEQKGRQLEAFERALPPENSRGRTICIPLDALDLWLACLNDLRLMLAAELRIRDGRPTPPVTDARDGRLANWILFDFLTELEVTLVYCLDRL